MSIVFTSENSVLLLLEQRISPDHFAQITRLVHVIRQELKDDIVDVVPSYASISITFQVSQLSSTEFEKKLTHIIDNIDHYSMQAVPSRVIEIPVYYGPEVALDLPVIAEQSGLAPEAVIRIHSEQQYAVYAMGFSPGFAYLGAVDPRIAFPRQATPRQKVLQGSVGIADQQTAVYPADSPGGWQIIGRTPMNLVDYESHTLTPFNVGDTVQFIPIDKNRYLQLGGTLGE